MNIILKKLQSFRILKKLSINNLYIILSVFLPLVFISIFALYKRQMYYFVLEENIFLSSANNMLFKKISDNKKIDLKHFRSVHHLSTLLDYRLKTIPNLSISYSHVDNNDVICTYKSVVYKTLHIKNCLLLIKHLQNNLLNIQNRKEPPCIFYLLDLKKQISKKANNISYYVLKIDFYIVSSKII